MSICIHEHQLLTLTYSALQVHLPRCATTIALHSLAPLHPSCWRRSAPLLVTLDPATQSRRLLTPRARAGLAFGAWLGETQHVTDDMLMAASETLPDLIRPTDMSLGRVFPRLADIRRGLTSACMCPCCQASSKFIDIPHGDPHTFRAL